MPTRGLGDPSGLTQKTPESFGVVDPAGRQVEVLTAGDLPRVPGVPEFQRRQGLPSQVHKTRGGNEHPRQSRQANRFEHRRVGTGRKAGRRLVARPGATPLAPRQHVNGTTPGRGRARSSRGRPGPAQGGARKKGEENESEPPELQ